MIGHFPAPGDDELLYSLCARYSDHMEYSKVAAVVYDLFGSKSAIATVDLPNRLATFVANLPVGYQSSVDDFIDGHTLLPFYTPFLSQQVVRQLRLGMQGKSRGVRARAGIAAYLIPSPEWLRFCPMCAEEDRNLYGEYCWHRVHQVPGVLVCPTHQVWLEESDVRTRNRSCSREFTSTERAIELCSPRPLDLSGFCEQVLLSITRDAAWLLSQRGLNIGLDALHNRYTVALIAKGLASHRGSVRKAALLEEFAAYYPSDLLETLHCGFAGSLGMPWPYRLVRNVGKAQHPLYHLLMVHFLGYTAAEFFALPAEYQPFGAGPWPCLNPVCPSYRQLVIQECLWEAGYAHYPKGRPVGKFACPVCGFIYARAGPDQTLEDRFRRNHHIEAYGPFWERQLELLWRTPQTSVDRIAQMLGVERSTVRRQAARLGLEHSRPQNPPLRVGIEGRGKKAEPYVPPLPKVEAYRAEWLAALKENPGAGMRVLERRFMRVYGWLRRYDAEWLKENGPSHMERSQPPPRVDWESRDRQLAQEVRAAATQIRSTPGRPIRVTKTAIGRRTSGMGRLTRALGRLPLTAAALSDVIESIEAFGVRRIEWAAAEFHKEGFLPSRRQLLARAGICRPADLPVVKEAIDAAMRV